MAPSGIKVAVLLFGQIRLVRVRDYYPSNLAKDRAHIYCRHEVCYIERGEDQYGIHYYQKSGYYFVCVERQDFINGELLYDHHARPAP